MIQEIGDSLVNPIVALWEGFVNVLPGLVGAIIVLLIGYIIAALVSAGIYHVFQKIKLDTWLLEKTKVRKLVGGLKLSQLLAVITKWYLFILFWSPAAGLVKLEGLSHFLTTVAGWVPNAIVSVLVLMVGIVIAGYVGDQIVETKSKSSRMIGDAAKVVIIIVAALMALEQIGIRVALLQNVVLLLVGGAMAGVAIGIGIAFGLGGKDEAKSAIGKLKKKL